MTLTLQRFSSSDKSQVSLPTTQCGCSLTVGKSLVLTISIEALGSDLVGFEVFLFNSNLSFFIWIFSVEWSRSLGNNVTIIWTYWDARAVAFVCRTSFSGIRGLCVSFVWFMHKWPKNRVLIHRVLEIKLINWKEQANWPPVTSTLLKNNWLISIRGAKVRPAICR